MKRIALILALALVSVALSAQDIITKRDGTDIEAKVLEVLSSEIKYKRASNPDGPTYTLEKSEILMIRYENGEKDIMEQQSPAVNQQRPAVNQQVVPSYKALKERYDPKDYVRMEGDTFNPVWTGVASAFIPGLGQLICGETPRGLIMLGSALVLEGVFGYCSYELSSFNNDKNLGYDTTPTPHEAQSQRILTATAVITGIAGLALDVWATIDAVQMAKVKNMYRRDLKMYPSMNCLPDGTMAPGFTLAMQF